MPIDPSIYNQLNTGGIDLGGMIAAEQDRKGRLSQLAQQKELTDMQIRAGQRAEAAYPQQQAEQQNLIKQKHMQELSSALAFGIQQKNGISNQELMDRTYEEAKRRGLEDTDIAQLFQPWASVQGQTDGQDVADVYAQRANPQEAIKQRLESMYRKPEKIDEGSPVTVMQSGKPVTIMSKSGRIVGEAVPSKALVNISTNEPPPKVSPGTRVWREGGEWKTEVMKGTPQWQALKSKEATDRSFVQNIVPTLKKNVTDIENLTKHEGFDNIFGRIGSIESLDLLPSTREARAKLDQVVGAMETAGMQMQRSTAGSAGTMTEKEWPKMQTYLNLVKTASTPEQAKEALRNAASSYERMQEVGKESYMNEWGGGQFGDPTVIDRLAKGDKDKPAQYERTATNPQTGQKIGLRNGQWEPIQ